MIISNSVSEEKNVLDPMHELSMIFDCVIDHSQKTNIKNEFINQNNLNFNQFGFISNEKFENVFRYNNNFSFVYDNHLHNEQISKKRNFLVKAIFYINNNIFSIYILYDKRMKVSQN